MNVSSLIYILGAARTPIGKFCGMLRDVSAVQLGAHAIAGALERAKISAKDVEEVIVGQVLQAGCGQNPARQTALQAGLPATVNAFTVNKCCGSGLKAVLLAAQAIKAGDADLLVAGGMESMSQAPFLLNKARKGWRLGHQEAQDSILTDGLTCAFCHWHMGNAAEFIAKKYNISRRQQDEYALESHRKAIRAQQSGFFDAEIIPLTVHSQGKVTVMHKDESPRPDTSLQALGKLSPAFQPKQGTVTAGNAPGLNDGAAAVVLCSEAYLTRRRLKPIAKILEYVAVGVEPAEIFIAPAIAAKALLKKMGAQFGDFDCIESNEAFAAQALACEKIVGWDAARVNVHGGAIALGHPVGASGARILVTLLHALKTRKGKRGLATLCMGGGNGLAVAVEMQ